MRPNHRKRIAIALSYRDYPRRGQLRYRFSLHSDMLFWHTVKVTREAATSLSYEDLGLEKAKRKVPLGGGWLRGGMAVWTSACNSRYYASFGIVQTRFSAVRT